MAPLMLEAIFRDITTQKWAQSLVTPQKLTQIFGFFALFSAFLDRKTAYYETRRKCPYDYQQQ